VYHVTKLKNGLTVATGEMPHMTSVSLGLWVGVGGRYENAEVNGVCHFIEHMLFKGTRRRSARQISQDVEGVGGYLNAFTSEEMTCYYSKAQHDRFDDLLDVLSDMFLESRFAKVEIDKERSVIKEEVAMYLDQPHHQVQELLNETLWPGHPLGRPLTGTTTTLDTLDRAAMIGYQRANYVASRTVITAAGQVQHRQLVKAASRLASRFPGGKPPQFVPALFNQTAPVIRLLTKQTEQTQIALGIRTCSRHDERRHALRMLNTMLGENMSTRLFQVIREDHGLAYAINSSLGHFDEVGVLVVSAGLDLDNLEKALKLIMREMAAFAKKLASGAEMRRARDYLLGQFELSMENTEGQMMWLGENLIGYDKIFAPDDIKQRIAEVKASEVRAVARDFFRPERLSLALVSPLKTDQHLGRWLKF